VKEFRCAVIGGGFAGAATAYHLARRGLGPIAILDREPQAGMHSSGRNAAMVRQIVHDRWIAALARDGARTIRSLLGGSRDGAHDKAQFRRIGSLLLASGRTIGSLERDAEVAREGGLATEWWTPAEAAGRIPLLEGADFELACFCPTDGVVDIAMLLDVYLRGAREGGTEILLGEEVQEVVVEGGRVAGVRTKVGTIRTRTVVNAAGAWAGDLARRAGARPIPLRPLRRHLVYTGPMDRVSRRWPYVWDVTHEIYFRPESEGLLLCPCDEDECEPRLPEADAAAVDLLHAKLSKHLPALSDIPVARSWAGLRVFAPDARFVIGPDPQLPGFFWAAGLGGHGVTASDAVGSLAADFIEHPERDRGNPFSPSRAFS